MAISDLKTFGFCTQMFVSARPLRSLTSTAGGSPLPLLFARFICRRQRPQTAPFYKGVVCVKRNRRGSIRTKIGKHRGRLLCRGAVVYFSVMFCVFCMITFSVRPLWESGRNRRDRRGKRKSNRKNRRHDTRFRRIRHVESWHARPAGV